MNTVSLARFGAAYARHRATEGRGFTGEDLIGLPYLRTGPLAQQWAVRARTFDAFMTAVVRPMAMQLGRPLSVIDLGAGSGWLSHRLALDGHSAMAFDIRDDDIDGLGAGAALVTRTAGRLQRVAAAFEAIPLADAAVDLAGFNASLHYALDLGQALAEAARVVRPGGVLAILDSPVYRREADGLAMAAEKAAQAEARFGDAAPILLGRPVVEFLTRERLQTASAAIGLSWRRRRVLYPLWYELRPLRARLRNARTPSRFDLWISVRP